MSNVPFFSQAKNYVFGEASKSISMWTTDLIVDLYYMATEYSQALNTHCSDTTTSVIVSQIIVNITCKHCITVGICTSIAAQSHDTS